MNRFRILRVSFGLVAVLLLAACTQNEMTNGNELPEGKYPLAFTATQSTATPQTRVAETTDGNGSTWTEGDQISVNINNGTQTGTYTLNADGTIKETVTPLYWQSTANATVNGWYPATDGTVNLSDQSAGLKYVLKGTGTGSYQSAPTLAFAHQLAKVRVKLTSATDLTTATVGVYSNPTCTHTKGTVTVTGTEQKSYLTMHKTTYNGVTCYEANVVPGTLEATNAFQISIGSKNTNVTLGSAVTLVAGKWHEITLTVNKPPVNLNDVVDPIAGDGEYIITGTGSKTIIINSGSPKITLKDVTSTASTAIQIENGASPTILLEGTNTFTASATGVGIPLSVIWLNGENACVTIDGNNTGRLTINQRFSHQSMTLNDAIIGGKADSNAGNITIRNAILNIDLAQVRSTHGAVIGSGMSFASSATCGNISISNTDLTINVGTTNLNGACIGTGLAQGQANSGNSCKQITIQLQSNTTKTEFLNKLKFTPPDNTKPEKVGKGGVWGPSTNTVAGVTWKTSDGTLIN